MKLAIMQPYAFPYLGYFQLLHAVDRFVLLDDVTFIKQGWINRNRILGPHGPLRITLPVEAASSNRRICELQLVAGTRWKETLLRTIEQSYRRAPGFDTSWPVVEQILRYPERRLNDWLRHALARLAGALAIDTPIVSAADVHPAGDGRGLDRVLEICRREGATDYLNAEGGRTLYPADAFAARGITLQFLEHQPRAYPQHGSAFVERLSIIDVLMFNSATAIATMLDDYQLVPAGASEDIRPSSPPPSP